MNKIGIPPLELLIPGVFAASGIVALIVVLSPSLVFYERPQAVSDIALPKRIETAALSNYAAIVRRPLFNDDRREDPPPPPPPPPKPPAPPSADHYQLVGLILTSSLKMALVERHADNQIVHVREGDTLDGWTVTEIAAAGVELSGSNGTTQLTIAHAGRKTQTGATASAGAH